MRKQLFAFRYANTRGDGFSTAGLEQAKDMAWEINNNALDNQQRIILSSPVPRAAISARYLSSQLGVDIKYVPELAAQNHKDNRFAEIMSVVENAYNNHDVTIVIGHYEIPPALVIHHTINERVRNLGISSRNDEWVLKSISPISCGEGFIFHGESNRIDEPGIGFRALPSIFKRDSSLWASDYPIKGRYVY